MAESGLSLGYSDIAALVARSALGYSSTSTAWTTEQTNDVNHAIKKGYSDFLSAHEWSFLRKFARITTTAGYSTGTIALTADDATVTLTTGTWPAWAAQGSLYYDSTEYEIASRTSDTEIELAAVWAGSTATGESYSIRRIAYDLPDDYGQPLSFFTYDTQHSRDPIQRINVNDLMALRSGSDTASIPRYAATRPKTSDFDNSTGQRYEVLFYPLADGVYTLGYTYAVLAENTLSSTNPYPLGGQPHAQTILDCCISAARYLYRDMSLAEYMADIANTMQSSIERDGAQNGEFQGYNMDRSDSRNKPWTDLNHSVTVNGTLPGY